MNVRKNEVLFAGLTYLSERRFTYLRFPILHNVQLEMERALLEGEQQIQLEQLDTAREKVAALEAKEAKLLAEAAAERSKVTMVFYDMNREFAKQRDVCFL